MKYRSAISRCLVGVYLMTWLPSACEILCQLNTSSATHHTNTATHADSANHAGHHSVPANVHEDAQTRSLPFIAGNEEDCHPEGSFTAHLPTSTRIKDLVVLLSPAAEVNSFSDSGLHPSAPALAEIVPPFRSLRLSTLRI